MFVKLGAADRTLASLASRYLFSHVTIPRPLR